MFGHAQRTVQHQGFGLAQRPNYRLHCVPAQLLQGRDAPVAVDHQVALRLLHGRHHHDRRLLTNTRQRRQQPSLPFWPLQSQVFPTPLELVKLQPHRPALSLPLASLSLTQVASRIAWPMRQVGPHLSCNQRDRPGTRIARCAAVVCP
jgi:hypothetical protein